MENEFDTSLTSISMPQVYNQIQFNFHQILLRTLIIYVDKQMCLKF